MRVLIPKALVEFVAPAVGSAENGLALYYDLLEPDLSVGFDVRAPTVACQTTTSIHVPRAVALLPTPEWRVLPSGRASVTARSGVEDR